MSYIKIIFEFQFILKTYCSFFQYVNEIGGGKGTGPGYMYKHRATLTSTTSRLQARSERSRSPRFIHIPRSLSRFRRRFLSQLPFI